MIGGICFTNNNLSPEIGTPSSSQCASSVLHPLKTFDTYR